MSKKQSEFTAMAAFLNAQEVPILDKTVAESLKNQFFTITQLKALILSEMVETNTWTPVAQNYSGVMTILNARFTKIGTICFIEYHLTFDATADASNIEFSGLPFTSVTSANYVAKILCRFSASLEMGYQEVNSNQTVITVLRDVAGAAQVYDDVVSNGIQGAGFYETA